jgi:RNA polymerase sigma-70 factor (ECF subfamily)
MTEYGSFYERYRDRIFAFLLRRSGDRELSEDLTQESFARHLHRYGGSVVSPYLLYTIARNVLIDHRRARRVEVPIFDEECDAGGGDAESLFLVREERRRVDAALGRLSERERQLLVLAASGVRYARIAALLGLNEANVKVLIHRARIRLRQLMEKGE